MLNTSGINNGILFVKFKITEISISDKHYLIRLLKKDIQIREDYIYKKKKKKVLHIHTLVDVEKFLAQPRREWPQAMKCSYYSTSCSSTHLSHDFKS